MCIFARCNRNVLICLNPKGKNPNIPLAEIKTFVLAWCQRAPHDAYSSFLLSQEPLDLFPSQSSTLFRRCCYMYLMEKRQSSTYPSPISFMKNGLKVWWKTPVERMLHLGGCKSAHFNCQKGPQKIFTPQSKLVSRVTDFKTHLCYEWKPQH